MRLFRIAFQMNAYAARLNNPKLAFNRARLGEHKKFA